MLKQVMSLIVLATSAGALAQVPPQSVGNQVLPGMGPARPSDGMDIVVDPSTPTYVLRTNAFIGDPDVVATVSGALYRCTTGICTYPTKAAFVRGGRMPDGSYRYEYKPDSYICGSDPIQSRQVRFTLRDRRTGATLVQSATSEGFFVSSCADQNP